MKKIQLLMLLTVSGIMQTELSTASAPSSTSLFCYSNNNQVCSTCGPQSYCKTCTNCSVSSSGLLSCICPDSSNVSKSTWLQLPINPNKNIYTDAGVSNVNGTLTAQTTPTA